MECRRAVYPACTEPSREPGTRGCSRAFAHVPVLRLTDRGRVHPDPRQDAADPAPSFGTFSGLRGAALLTSTQGQAVDRQCPQQSLHLPMAKWGNSEPECSHLLHEDESSTFCV